MYYVYILKTSGGTYYTGQTNNLEVRLKQHKSKGSKSAKYLRRFESFELVYVEECKSRSEALKKEIKLKQKSHLFKKSLSFQATESCSL